MKKKEDTKHPKLTRRTPSVWKHSLPLFPQNLRSAREIETIKHFHDSQVFLFKPPLINIVNVCWNIYQLTMLTIIAKLTINRKS